MEVHGRADTQPQPVEDLMPDRVGGCKLKEVAACGGTCWGREGPGRTVTLLGIHAGAVFLKDCILWKGPTQEKLLKNCIQ